jgi:hypothetical protein
MRLKEVMMRRILLGLAPLAALHAFAQTHKVAKPETVVRAVAVYEWTGEERKPTASRVVPVSLFINGELEDAGIFMARPVPFALDTGVTYETEKAGKPEGTVEIAYERHLTAPSSAPADAEIDDGWLGYGIFKPKPKETLVAKKQSGPLPKVVASGGSKPHFAGKPEASDGAAATDSTAKTSDSDHSDEDSNRPTFHRRPDASSTGSSTTQSGGGTTSSDGGATKSSTADPDDPAERPTLKRRSASDIKADQKKKDTARVMGGTDLNDDPDRPSLHRGKPKSETDEEAIPPLQGLPKDMHQMVAVSDAKDRPEHDFRRPFESDAERSDILAKMESFARAQLASYKVVGPAVSAPAAPPAQVATAPGRTGTSKAKRRVSPPAAPVLEPLNDEVLNGYTLSYGGAPTYVYSASSPGAGGVTRYVSVIAQEEPITGLKVALANVTDSAHLDATPQMRLVDVVDADASNRASLLMDLRAQRTRQFALYRVIGAKADQVFVTGSTE